ncbi:hypothetical protein FA95DRAFT_1612467 [Auriscalpium vulgare]|uniref:Uncharacterized protein n=1 Tax=Auriscalpium vulgare TaxID=40419 RepID=A0ACB8R633_9AGAM|nr:hypothetical protein FA95DRAFT_1612467 [Auriscalpium vulgare]
MAPERLAWCCCSQCSRSTEGRTQQKVRTAREHDRLDAVRGLGLYARKPAAHASGGADLEDAEVGDSKLEAPRSQDIPTRPSTPSDYSQPPDPLPDVDSDDLYATPRLASPAFSMDDPDSDEDLELRPSPSKRRRTTWESDDDLDLELGLIPSDDEEDEDVTAEGPFGFGNNLFRAWDSVFDDNEADPDGDDAGAGDATNASSLLDDHPAIRNAYIRVFVAAAFKGATRAVVRMMLDSTRISLLAAAQQSASVSFPGLERFALTLKTVERRLGVDTEEL